jgi:hypothetical protein
MKPKSIAKIAGLSADEQEAVARLLGDPQALRGLEKLLRAVLGEHERRLLNLNMQEQADERSLLYGKLKVDGMRKLADEVASFKQVLKEIDED